MVLQIERYPGGYHRNSYSAYEGPNGSYSNFQDVTEQTTPYLGYPQGPTYQSSHVAQPQSGWYPGGGYQSNGGSHYSGGDMEAHLKPTNGGYESSPYKNPHSYGSTHGQSHEGLHIHGHGSPHGQSHGSPHGQSHGGLHIHGHGSPHGLSNGHGGPQSHDHGGYGNSHGYGGGAPNQYNKLTHGLNGYGNGTPNYGHNPSGMNNGYQKPTWDLKGLDDDDE